MRMIGRERDLPTVVIGALLYACMCIRGLCVCRLLICSLCMCLQLVCVYFIACVCLHAHICVCVCGQRGSPTLPDDSSMENTINSLTASQLFPQRRLKSPNWNDEQLGTDERLNQMFHWSNDPAAPVFTLSSHSSLTAVSWADLVNPNESVFCFLVVVFFIITQSQLCRSLLCWSWPYRINQLATIGGRGDRIGGRGKGKRC